MLKNFSHKIKVMNLSLSFYSADFPPFLLVPNLSGLLGMFLINYSLCIYAEESPEHSYRFLFSTTTSHGFSKLEWVAQTKMVLALT